MTAIDYGPTFNRDLAVQWVHALESGEYQQGKGFLHPTPDTYCCLGVMCDLADPNGWEPPDDPARPIPSINHTTVLPDSNIAHQVGLIGGRRYDGDTWIATDAILIKLDRRQSQMQDIALDGFNDNYDLSFDEIADILRIYYGMPPRERTEPTTTTTT